MNVHAVRSGGWSALAFTVVVIATAFLYGVPPDAAAAPGDVAAWLSQHRMALLVSAWLNLPAMVLFLWFAVALRIRLQNTLDPSEGLPTYALAAAITSQVPALGTMMLQAALAFHAPVSWPPSLMTNAWDAWNIVGTAIFGPLGLFVFAVSLSGMRHGTLPAWLNWIGYLTAVGGAIATFTIFFQTGALALGSPLGVFIGFLPFIVWVVAAGIIMLRTAEGSVRPA